VREEEKMELQKLAERVPIPIKDNIDEPICKVNVLLQAYISQLKLDGFALIADMVYVTQSAGRILRALFEICLRREWAQLSRKTLDLCKMVDRRMWLSMTPLRQFRGINLDMMRRLESKNFPWDRMYDLNPQELGELARNNQAGKLLYQLVHQFPRLELQTRVQPITRSVLKIDFTVTPNFNYDQGEEGKPGVHNAAGEMFWILVEDCDQERILFSDQFVLKPRYAEEEHHLAFTVPLYEPLPPNYFISVISDRWLHSETRLPVSFKHLILPAKFPPHTELLDLQPLPISGLVNPEYIKIFASQGWRYFNPIQTQVFNSLFNTDENVFIGAPAGSGKTICAELAILRQWTVANKKGDDTSKIVYVAPLEDLVAERYLDWSNRMGKTLGKTVVRLVGETTADLKSLEQGDLVIATPEHWDMISRRWKQRKNVQAVALLVVDEIHLLGSDVGPVIEVIVSRTRFMASQLETKIRIVALSASLGNARDLGEWIGCGQGGNNTVFNFHSNVRPVPMEIHIQSFAIPHFASLMLAMSKPSYHSISQYCCSDGNDGSRQAIVFVPNRRQTRVTALEFITYTSIENTGRKFLHLPDLTFAGDEHEDVVEEKVNGILQSYLTALSDPGLRETVAHGVGYINEGMSERDRRIVLRLYQRNVIQVLVASRDVAYGLYDPENGESINAHMVVIMGTQYYDGREHRYVDYSLAEALQMCGKACKGDLSGLGQAVDGSGLTDEGFSRVLLLCPVQKKEFYKKFLYEGLPIESHLDYALHDHFNAEIVTKTIETKQDAVDYLTWTYLYRRMAQNPNYYNLLGVTHRHLSDHLSELVETTLTDLATSKCIAIDEDEISVSALNLGMYSFIVFAHLLFRYDRCILLHQLHHG
jgi:pre-mRNA-splicing helicase BRR2